MSDSGGGEFLGIKYPDLQNSRQVQNSVEKKKRIEGKSTPNNPENRIDVYLNRLEDFFDNPGKKARFIDRFILIDKHNIPNAYFDLQRKIARDQGHGEIEITPQLREMAGQIIYTDQKKSLDIWVDYLNRDDTVYPPWFKYYTMRNVIKMGAFDKGKKEFSKRTKHTTGIFPDLNREALAFTYDVLEKHYLKHEKPDNEELNRILDTANFPKIYAYAIDKVTPAIKENREKVEGEWTKFNKESDPTALYESLQGHGTGWCTAGEETARIQLKNGDFYVYYSKDQGDKNTVPRIAIRMENGQVAEVRGVGTNQNLEGNMTDIAQEKYRQLPGGEKFDKKDQDMKLLTKIDNKIKDSQELTKEDLRFIYEIDRIIEGFGHKRDPRVAEIVDKRNVKKDLIIATGYSEDQISTTKDEALKGGIKFHYGDLDLREIYSVEGLVLPETIDGYLGLKSLKSAVGLKLPKTLGGYLHLGNLTSVEGLVLPETIGGYLHLGNLTSVEGLVLPETIEGNLILRKLHSAVGLKLPKTIIGDLYLSSLTTADGLRLLETINGSLYLNNLTTTKGLVLPETIDGGLYLDRISSTERELLRKQYPQFKIF